MQSRIATCGRLLVAGFLLLAGAAGLSAQESGPSVGPAANVFAPFASRIRVAVADPRVRVSWSDTNDVTGPYRIYRHTRPLSETTFAEAVLVGTVERGVEQFTDTPATPGDYYYGVLATDADGTEYELFITHRNVTASPITIAHIASPEDQLATVLSISSETRETDIIVRFQAPQAGRRIAVLRLNRPITTLEDVAEAIEVGTAPSSSRSVVDTLVVPGVPYYYAALDTEAVAAGELTLIATQNTTAVPAELRIAEGATDEVAVTLPEPDALRRVPLPFLRLDASLSTGAELTTAEFTIPERRPISEVTDKALTVLSTHIQDRSRPPLQPVVLIDEQQTGLSGPEATLKSIVDGSYARMAWEETERLLTNFLTLPLDEAVAARARFYRAVSLYFQDQPEAAFMEFLLAEEYYYTPVQPWLDAILSGRSS